MIIIVVSWNIYHSLFFENIDSIILSRKNNLSEDEDDDDNSNDTSFECSHDIWESTNNDLALRGIDLDR